jgi:hypothetical protein
MVRTKAWRHMVSLLALAGCGQAQIRLEPLKDAAAPQDPVGAAIAAAQAGAVPVALPYSRIAITPAAPSEKPSGAQPSAAGAKAKPAALYQVSVLPRPGPHRYNVAGVNDLLSRNALGVTHVENTDLAQSVSNSFTDQTVTRIQQIGAVVGFAVKAGAGLLSFAPASTAGSGQSNCALPALAIDVTSTDARSGTVTSQDGSCIYNWSLIVAGAPAAGTVTHAELDAQLAAKPRPVRFWPVPACATAQLTIMGGGLVGGMLDATVQIADPDRVRLYPLPEKGKIALHPVCGADIADTPVDRWQTAFDAISELNKQVEAVAKPEK